MTKDDYVKQLECEIKEHLLSGVDRKTVKQLATDTLNANFPSDNDNSFYAWLVLNQVESALKKVGKTTGRPTVNIINITNSFNETGAIRDTEPQVLSQTLSFRLIADDSLTLEDRIIFSFCWKWAYMNTKRAKKNLSPKATTNRRLRDATGFRRTTVNDSLRRLKAGGYLRADLSPIPSKQNKDARILGFRKLTLPVNGSVTFDVFRGIVQSNNKTMKAGWYVKCLGISKRTVYRWLNKATKGADTVGTARGNIRHHSREPLARKAGTVGTLSKE